MKDIAYKLHDISEHFIADNDSFRILTLDNSLRRLQKLWHISISKGHEILVIVYEPNKLGDRVHSGRFNLQGVPRIQKTITQSDHKVFPEGLSGVTFQKRFHNVPKKLYSNVPELRVLRLCALPKERHEVRPLPLGNSDLGNGPDDVCGTVTKYRRGV